MLHPHHHPHPFCSATSRSAQVLLHPSRSRPNQPFTVGPLPRPDAQTAPRGTLHKQQQQQQNVQHQQNLQQQQHQQQQHKQSRRLQQQAPPAPSTACKLDVSVSHPQSRYVWWQAARSAGLQGGHPAADGAALRAAERTPTPHQLAAAFGKLLEQPTWVHTSTQQPSGQPPTALHPQQHKEQQALHILQLLEHTARVAEGLQPHQASLILYVCAKRRLPCAPGLVSAVLGRLQAQHLQQLPPQGLVNTVWALAVLQLQPGPDWVDALYAATTTTASSRGAGSSGAGHTPQRGAVGSSSAGAGGFGAFNRHQQVQLLWAAGRLRQQPPAGWVAGLLCALQPQLCALSPSELTNVLWGLAQIGFRPGRLWLGAWFLASRRALPRSSPQCLACQVASLGVLRLRVSSGRWLAGLRAAVAQHLDRLQPQVIATLLCGLAKQRAAMPPHWVRHVLARQLELLGSSSSSSRRGLTPSAEEPCPRDMAATVWSLPLLLYPTAVEWAAQPCNAALLKQLAAISLLLLPACSVGQLVQLAVGFARLGYFPGVHWLKTHENAVAQHKLSLTDTNRRRLQAAMSRLWSDSS